MFKKELRKEYLNKRLLFSKEDIELNSSKKLKKEMKDVETKTSTTSSGQLQFKKGKKQIS